MSRQRYPEEFKIEAVKQVTEKGKPVADVAQRLGFFQLLKRERIRRKIYATRDEARSDIFDYIEMFYNPKRRHSSAMRKRPANSPSELQH